MLVALGWANGRIAAAMYLTVPTLRKHYFSELATRRVARDRLEANIAMKLWDGVLAGNVTAIREFQAFKDRNDRMEIERVMGSTERSGDTRQDRVGKKQLDARRAADADADLTAELDSEATAQNAVH